MLFRSEDGDLSASLDWSSDLDGPLGTGASVTPALTVGLHTITASASDSLGLGGSDQITLTVNANAAPIVTITAPPDASIVTEGAPLTLTGTAIDAEDGDLTGSLDWSSDLDGPLGTGPSVSPALTDWPSETSSWAPTGTMNSRSFLPLPSTMSIRGWSFFSRSSMMTC